MILATLEHQHRKAWSHYLSEFLPWTIVNTLINQHRELSLTYGKVSKTNCKKLDFLLAIHLLRKKSMGKLAKKNRRKLNSGPVQIFLSLSLFLPIVDSGEQCLHWGAVRSRSSSLWSLGTTDHRLRGAFPCRNARATLAGPQNKHSESICSKCKLCNTRVFRKIIWRKLKLE